MKKMWKRILTFVLAVGMMITTNDFSSLTVAYAAETTNFEYSFDGTNWTPLSKEASISVEEKQIINIKKTDGGSFLPTRAPEGLTFSRTNQGTDPLVITCEKVGTYSISVVDLASGSPDAVSFTLIVQKSINSSEIAVSMQGSSVGGEYSYPYTGKQVQPVSGLTDNGVEIPSDYYYQPVYTNNINVTKDGAEEPNAAIKGKNLYTDSRDQPFKIVPCDFSSNGETGNQNALFLNSDGTSSFYSKVTYQIVVDDRAALFEKGQDYANNIRVCAYYGETEVYEIPQVVNGGRNYNVTITPGKNDEGIDTMKVTVTGDDTDLSGNCTGTFEKPFERGDLGQILENTTITFEDSDSYKNANTATNESVYNHQPQEPALPRITTEFEGKTVTLEEGKDYELEYASNEDVGTATVTIKAIESSAYTGEIECTFEITPRSINALSITSLDDQPYTGKPVEVNMDTLTDTIDGKEYTLELGKDYNLQGNGQYTNVGDTTAKVTVAGTGNYTGTKTLGFKIKYNIMPAADQGTVKVSTYNGGEALPISITNGTMTPSQTIEALYIRDTYQNTIPPIHVEYTKPGGTTQETLTVNESDYTISYAGFTSGELNQEGTVTITPNQNSDFMGSITLRYRIVANDLTKNTEIKFVNNKGTNREEEIKNFEIEYTGSEVGPADSIIKVEQTLYKDTKDEKTYVIDPNEYDITYKNAINVPASQVSPDENDLPQVVVTANSNRYGGNSKQLSKTYTITPVDIDDSRKVTVTDETLIMDYTSFEAIVGSLEAFASYNRDATLKPELTFNKMALEFGKDFDVELLDEATKAGNHSWRVTGKGNYTGTLSRKPQYTIKYNLKDAKIVWYKNGVKQEESASGLEIYTFVPKGVKPRALGRSIASSATGFQVVMEAGEGSTEDDVILEPSNYDVEYSTEYKQEGVDSLVIKAKNTDLVSGQKTVEFEVQKNDISNMDKNGDGDVDADSGYKIRDNSLNIMYTGSPLEPKPEITYTFNGEDLPLVEGEDYRLEYSLPDTGRVNVIDRKDANAPYVKIIGLGGFTGEVTIPFSILPKPITEAFIEKNSEGKPVNFEELLFYEDSIPVPIESYTDPDTQVTTKYIFGNYNITVASSSRSDSIYAQEADPVISDPDRNRVLVSGADYIIEYVPPINGGIGRYTYRIIGRGNYGGDYELPYSVKHKFEEGEGLVTIRYPDFSVPIVMDYTGREITFPTRNIDLAFNGTTLIQNSHYKVSYSDNVDPGEASVIFEGIGDSYAGTITKNFRIRGSLSRNRGQLDIKPVLDQAYTGMPIRPKLEISWKNSSGGLTPLIEGYSSDEVGADYVVVYENNVEVSREVGRPAKMTIIGINDYTGEIEIEFNIVKPEPINDGNITITGLNSQYTFTGNAQTPTPRIDFTDDAGVRHQMIKDTDYTLEYFDNVEVGTATMIITGQNGYVGTITRTFQIVGAFSESNIVIDSIPDQLHTGNRITPPIYYVFWKTASGQMVLLTENVDYTVGYGTNTAVGQGTVEIRAVNGSSYTGLYQARFNIVGEEDYVPPEGGNYTITDDTVIISNFDGTIPFTGNRVSLSDNQKIIYSDGTKYVVLEEGTYTITYPDIVEPGQAEITITATGTPDSRNNTFTGTARIPVTIVGDLRGDNVTVDEIEPQSFTGKPVEPEVKVTWRAGSVSVSAQDEDAPTDDPAGEPADDPVNDGTSVVLEKDKDYTVSYERNIDAGTATAIITGIGCYSGTRSVNFEILEGDEPEDPTKISIRTKGEVTLEDTPQIYDGTEKRPAVTVTATVTVTAEDGTETETEKVLTEGTDYELSYEGDIVNVGTAVVKVVGRGEYTGTVRKEFTIAPAIIRDGDITLLQASYTYDSTPKTPDTAVTVNGRTLQRDIDYTVSYTDNIEVGTAQAVITGIGNYSGIVSKPFTITSGGGSTDPEDPNKPDDPNKPTPGNKTDIADVAIVGGIASRYTYTGSQIKPAIVIRGADGKTLTANKDYTVQYYNNINAGSGWMVITGKGDYTGLLTPSFTIVKKNINTCAITLPKSAVYTGLEVRPAITVKNGSRKLVPGSDYSITYSNNIKLGRATVTVRGEGNFTGVKKMYFNIIVKATKNLKLSSSKMNSVKLKWTKVAKASGYEVYTSNLKKKVATVTKNKNTVTIKKLKTGVVYKYRVRAYIKQGKKKYYGAFSNTLTVTTAPKTVTATVASNKLNTVVVKWNKVSGSGYQVYRSVKRNSGYRKIATVTSSSKRSYTDKRAASGGIYYYKVRAYRKSGSQYVYGAFSVPQQITAR